VYFCTAVYISEKQLLVLNFRGLSFEFRIDPKLEVSEQLNEVPLILYYNLICEGVDCQQSVFAFYVLMLLCCLLIYNQHVVVLLEIRKGFKSVKQFNPGIKNT